MLRLTNSNSLGRNMPATSTLLLRFLCGRKANRIMASRFLNLGEIAIVVVSENPTLVVASE